MNSFKRAWWLSAFKMDRRIRNFPNFVVRRSCDQMKNLLWWGESVFSRWVSILIARIIFRSGLTGNLHEMENRYGKTVRSTSEELSSNRKSAGIARATLESGLK